MMHICLSIAYIGPKLRTERPRKNKIGTEVAHVTRDSDTTFKVKDQGHQAAFVACSSHYLTCMDDNSLRQRPERAASCLSTLRRGHSVAASRLQLVIVTFGSNLCYVCGHNIAGNDI